MIKKYEKNALKNYRKLFLWLYIMETLLVEKKNNCNSLRLLCFVIMKQSKTNLKNDVDDL